MNILMVSLRYPPFIGGLETQLQMVVHELARRHSVAVTAAQFRALDIPKRFRALEDSLLLPDAPSSVDRGVPIHSIAPSMTDRLRMIPIAVRGIPKVSRYFREPLRRHCYKFYRAVYVPKLRALIRGKDIVHSVTSDYLGWAAEEAARAENVPFVLSTYVHPGQYGDDPGNVKFYKRADRVFSLLESDRKKLIDLGVAPEKIRLSGVVPLLPETSDPAGFRRRHHLRENPIVLFAGRLEEYKGPKVLLEASRRVWPEMSDVHFLFAGPTGDEARGWFAQFADSRIRYLGVISDQEKADAMAACDLFCMPSIAEVLPAVYLEAWSYGKPVLGGTAYGLPELIEGNGAGLTVNQDPELIASRIIDLLRDDARRRLMGERGRDLVARRFSKPALVGSLESAYEEVLGLSSPDESHWRNESVQDQRGNTLISQLGKR